MRSASIILLHLGHSPGPANFRTHDSTPGTLTPEGNKSRVSGVGVESNRPTTNFPGISVDSNRVNCLVEKNGLDVGARRSEIRIEQGGRRDIMV